MAGKRTKQHHRLKNYDDLFAKYNTLKKISFDYAVVEHEPLIEVMRFSGTWKDLGTWNTLTEAMDSKNVGEALFNEKCENVHVVNELNMPVLCMGLKDVVVSASPEGILVSDKEQSSYIKPFPKSDVLKFFLEDNCSIVVRPSGTEPKLKAYISVSAATKEEAQVVEGELARAVEEKM